MGARLELLPHRPRRGKMPRLAKIPRRASMPRPITVGRTANTITGSTTKAKQERQKERPHRVGQCSARAQRRCVKETRAAQPLTQAEAPSRVRTRRLLMTCAKSPPVLRARPNRPPPPFAITAYVRRRDDVLNQLQYKIQK